MLHQTYIQPNGGSVSLPPCPQSRLPGSFTYQARQTDVKNALPPQKGTVATKIMTPQKSTGLLLYAHVFVPFAVASAPASTTATTSAAACVAVYPGTCRPSASGEEVGGGGIGGEWSVGCVCMCFARIASVVRSLLINGLTFRSDAMTGTWPKSGGEARSLSAAIIRGK